MAKAFLKERVYGVKYSPEKNQVLGPVVQTTSSRTGWGRDHVHHPELTGFFNANRRKIFTLATDEWGGRVRSGTPSGPDAESMRKRCLLLWVCGRSSQGSRKQSCLMVGGA